MLKKIIVIFLFLSIASGCGKDDICTGDTPTTPKLIIIFKSKINPNVYKVVDNLTVTTIIESDTTDIIKSITTDSIAIPLNTGVDFTKFQFYKDNTSNNEGNLDLVTFNYQRDFIYINRACAFKSYFINLGSEFDSEDNTNWIQEISITKPNVENEDETHVIIYH